MATTLGTQAHRKVWTRDEAAKLRDIFAGQRYELIEGDLIDKRGQRPQHAYVVSMLTSILAVLFAGRVRIQLPIALPEPEGTTSEPEPDVVLLQQDAVLSEFCNRHPGPQDIAMLIEVSDTTLQMDREIKGRLYARSGIAVCWIADVQQRRVIVFDTPGPDEYKTVRIFEQDEHVVVNGSRLLVRELFGTPARNREPDTGV